MNIFWLDQDLTRSAQAHCDKHVVKMCVEYAQLLSSAMRIISPNLCNESFPYRLTHKNHPCAVWTRKSSGNFHQLKLLALELGKEYTWRYGKQHKSIDIIMQMPWDLPNFTVKEMTEPPQCMPDEYKHTNYIEAYRRYYLGGKANIATWKNREIPQWWNR